MQGKKKILGNKRRELILEWLINSQTPITGNELAEKTNVSRQVIVQDISLLKAKNHSIIATSQGYMYLKPVIKQPKRTMILACKHAPEDTEKELLLLIDCGVTIKDVTVEHPVYGDLSAPLLLNSRKDVITYIQKMNENKASLLSELTNGIHLHTIEADHEHLLTEAELTMKKHGFLLSSE